MSGLGTVINVAAILAGGLIGLLFGRFIGERHRDTLCKACGLAVIFIGAAGSPKGMFSVEGDKIVSGGDFLIIGCLCLGALTGELINIDGNSNRVGCLVHGPEHVFMIVGMNKVVSDVASGVKRVQDIASPPNGVRLQKNTPCALTGRCGNCLSPDCMCNQIVITRRSGHTGRICVFLVAEDLGF